MGRFITILLLLSISAYAHTENISLQKKDYLTLIVGNYVHSFKEFDTSVVSFDDSVSIGIYYDLSTQKKGRAKQLAERYRSQIPLILNNYEWAKNINVRVTVYSEDNAGRGW